MPSAISSSISRVLRDTKISNNEVTGLIVEAKRNLTPEVKAELKALLDSHADKFSNGGKRDLQRFLSMSGVGTINEPRPPPPPPTPRDLADPTVLTKHTTDTTWKPVQDGKLYVDSISYDDVVQGSIGDCYLAASLSAVAAANPDIVKNAITDNGDNTYSVRFYEGGREVKIQVDGDVAQSSYGGARYAHSRQGSELWVGLLEKAYAQWKGGYSAIGNGGWMAPALEALTGAPASHTQLAGLNAEQVAGAIEAAAARGRPMTASTSGTPGLRDLVPHHAYSVFGVVRQGGEAWVQLRNPWASGEVGRDGQLDGSFMMRASDFVKHFEDFQIG